jgi:hypothetical protein
VITTLVPTVVLPAGSVVVGVIVLAPVGSGDVGVQVHAPPTGITISTHPGIGVPVESLSVTLSPGVPLPVRVGVVSLVVKGFKLAAVGGVVSLT